MKWKLSWLVSAGFGIAMVLVAVVSGVAYMNTLELIRDIRLVARTQEVSGQIETVFGLVKDMQVGVRGYILAGEAAFLEPYQKAVKDIPTEMATLHTLVKAKPEQLQRFDLLVSLVDQETLFVRDLVQLRETAGLEAAIQRVKVGEGRVIMRALRKVVGEMEDAEDVLLRKREAYANSSARDTIVILICGSGLAVVIIGVATVVTYYDSRARDALERTIMQISEREQERIGRDLHDGLCQQLTGIGLLSQAIRKRLQFSEMPEAADVRKVEELTNKALVSARGVARGLCPVEVESNGLMSALEELVTAVRDATGKTCHFYCPTPVFIEDKAMATHLYRIAQEAMHNAIRHAEAPRITVGLGLADGQLSLEIVDNGKGLEMPLRNKGGFGLDVMRHRAKAIGGSLEIYRPPDGGTAVKVRVAVPLSEEARKDRRVMA